MAGDWIKLHRKAIESRAFADDWLWRLWTWCLLRATWKPCWCSKEDRQLLPGQFVTGRHQAAGELGVSGSKWYRGMHTLQEWEQLRLEVNSIGTVVTICNWDTYQSDDAESEQPVNSRWTASEQPVNTIEEGKEREEGKDTPFPLFETNTPKPKAKAPEPLAFPDPLDVPDFHEAWQRWEKHRREIKHPLTPSMRKTQLKTLASWGLRRAIACIDHTIFKGWQGLREPDATDRNGRAAVTVPRLPPPPARPEVVGDQQTWRARLTAGVGVLPGGGE